MDKFDGPVIVDVLSDGQEIGADLSLTSVDVQSEITGEARATLRISDGRLGDPNFNWTDGAEFQVGTKITIKGGYDGIRWTIFEGSVMAQRVVFNPASGISLEVICAHHPISPNVEHKLSKPVAALRLEEDMLDLVATTEQPRSKGKRPASGTVSYPGSGEIVAGDTIEMSGIGKVFSGPALVVRISHQMSDGQWITEAQFDAPQSGD